MSIAGIEPMKSENIMSVKKVKRVKKITTKYNISTVAGANV